MTPQPTARHGHRRRWRLSKLSLIPALIMVLGMSAITYPHAAAWFAQLRQSQVISGYGTLIDNARPDRHIQLERAQAYNQALNGGAIYEAGSNIPTASDVSEASDPNIPDYNEQLKADDNGLMARLRIPKIKLDLPIYHGTTDKTLLQGLGHLRGTALPVGGEGMRPVITGHRGLAEAEMFTRLDEIDKGDTFTIEVFGEVLTYRVFEKIVVEPDERHAFQAVAGRDLVTLVTCTPLGINSHRILITGERIIPTPASEIAKAGKEPEVPGFPWWAVLYGLGLVAVLVYIWWAGLPPKRRREDEDAVSQPTTRRERRRAAKAERKAARAERKAGRAAQKAGAPSAQAGSAQAASGPDGSDQVGQAERSSGEVNQAESRTGEVNQAESSSGEPGRPASGSGEPGQPESGPGESADEEAWAVTWGLSAARGDEGDSGR